MTDLEAALRHVNTLLGEMAERAASPTLRITSPEGGVLTVQVWRMDVVDPDEEKTPAPIDFGESEEVEEVQLPDEGDYAGAV